MKLSLLSKHIYTLVITIVITLFSSNIKAQNTLKRVYNEDINPLEQIDLAIEKASKEGKNVICQVGGNWCIWCLRFADFAENDSIISKIIDENYVYIHVNYNPKRSADEAKTQQAEQLMKRLNYPNRFGFPVFVVIGSNGEILHTQDSVFLEEGKGYNQEKTMRFLEKWTPNFTNTKE